MSDDKLAEFIRSAISGDITEVGAPYAGRLLSDDVCASLERAVHIYIYIYIYC